MQPIFFPADGVRNDNSLNVINGKKGYFVWNVCSSYSLKDFAKVYPVKIVEKKGATFDDSVYLIPVNVTFIKEKRENNCSDSVQIIKGDTLIMMDIYQSFNGSIIDVDAPFVPKAID